MKIYLDTNIICQDYYFKGATAKLFLESSKYFPAKIIIPEVVLDEVINRFYEDLNESYAKTIQDIAKLNKLTGKDIDIKLDMVSLVKDYDTYLKNLIQQYHIIIEGYPNIAHKKLVKKALARHKPFKSNGSGYRDALIWETIYSSLSLRKEKFYFLSANSKDFGREPEIDPDLFEDSTNLHDIKIYNSIKSFMKEIGSKSLERKELIDNELATYGITKFDIHIWIKDQLLKELSTFDLEVVLAGFPQGVGSAQISAINEINEIVIKEISKIIEDQTKIVAKIKVHLSVISSIDSDWDDYVNHSEVQDFWGYGLDKFSITWTEFQQSIYVVIDLLFDLSKTEILESVQIIEIEGMYGTEIFS